MTSGSSARRNGAGSPCAMTGSRMIEGGRRIRGAAAGDLPRQNDPALPLVSVITAVRNGAAGIETTINAALGQTYANVENFIVDTSDRPTSELQPSYNS